MGSLPPESWEAFGRRRAALDPATLHLQRPQLRDGRRREGDFMSFETKMALQT